jgi:hypothetical protein
MIFEQLGEQVGNYSNIKLYATNPKLCELSAQSKTVYQYLIKDSAKLVLTADFAFGLRPISKDLKCKYKIAVNGNTLTSTVKPPAEPKLPTILPPIPLPPAEGEPKVEQPR